MTLFYESKFSCTRAGKKNSLLFLPTVQTHVHKCIYDIFSDKQALFYSFKNDYLKIIHEM